MHDQAAPQKSEIVKSELEKIRKAKGRVLPEDVVSQASNPRHPLHSFFEWDDSKAAHEHRIWQARKLIVSVKLEVIINEVTLRPVYYVKDPAADYHEQGYVRSQDLRGKQAKTAALMQAELSRVDAILTRTIDLADFLGVKDETLDVIRKVRGIREAIDGK